MNAPVKVLPGNLKNAPVVMPRATGVGNGSVAPVCPVSKSEAVPGSPGNLLPLPPRAIDLPTAIMAINQLTQIVNYLINPPVTVNNNLFTLPLFRPVWVETGRQMATTRIYNPDDKSMWVDVEHIVQLTMSDKIFGQAMILNYAAPKLGGVGVGPTGVVGASKPGQ
jgi:hypothetical protein